MPTTSRGGSHTPLAHTADVGLSAEAPELAALFEHAGAALAELIADVDPEAGPTVREDVAVEAEDAAGLAYTWLNELIALADVHHGAIADVRVERLSAPTDGEGRWTIRATVGLRPYADGGVRPRIQVKSATYHRLAVDRRGSRWTLRAYLDV